ncbi:Phosphate transport system permease protein PstC (TC 3.A.1.7.1) [Olavius algarvensis spirochete endosymbiont]|uniref:phosphate ABC transporter permease subunit PstC n=1 Tax=Olavius algarvensis spirochete endosymbiont TaxID=260710 RepID=UPI000F266A71|nr:phosphate ABC transporter permease subunit PstC [Olavius algarvensis spirochete endosymbiont]CAD7843741.1 MAG: Phosphate ABC transporter, permease protein PstC (TC 3.A.1.7.1) [Olavius algarvensis spirochete endosymbiont]VDB00451.1 Phosphate transport system permease protein PstC (TC 3.A.1.7.1) [Olavius algarvensis spirochete endosymbiont]
MRRTEKSKRATSFRERLVEFGLLGSGVLSIFTTVAILTVLAFETVGFFQEVTFAEFFGDTQWTPLFSDKHFGIWPLIGGTFLTSLIAVAVALPLGLLAAVYLSEFARESVRKAVKPALEVLAGVPTIVYGYFALVFITPLLQKFIPGLAGFNALSPGIVMGIMIIPMISSLSEDALHAVPATLKEGSYALGAGRLATIFRVTIPSAFSGIVASVILATSRAIGETMIVAIAAGQQPRLTLDPRVPIETMTAYIVQISLGDTPTGTIEYKTIFVVGASLFAITFVMNILSQRIARRFRGKI